MGLPVTDSSDDWYRWYSEHASDLPNTPSGWAGSALSPTLRRVDPEVPSGVREFLSMAFAALPIPYKDKAAAIQAYFTFWTLLSVALMLLFVGIAALTHSDTRVLVTFRVLFGALLAEMSLWLTRWFRAWKANRRDHAGDRIAVPTSTAVEWAIVVIGAACIGSLGAVS